MDDWQMIRNNDRQNVNWEKMSNTYKLKYKSEIHHVKYILIFSVFGQADELIWILQNFSMWLLKVPEALFKFQI